MRDTKLFVDIVKNGVYGAVLMRDNECIGNSTLRAKHKEAAEAEAVKLYPYAVSVNGLPITPDEDCPPPRNEVMV